MRVEEKKYKLSFTNKKKNQFPKKLYTSIQKVQITNYTVTWYQRIIHNTK